MFKEFREFALRGNVMDMAVGIIIGAAFGRVISSLVNDILMPSLADAQATGVATINYGVFISQIPLKALRCPHCTSVLA